MRRNRRSVLPTFFISLSLLIALSICLGSALDSAPAPLAFPKPEGWVTDQAGFLDAPTRMRVERILTELERKSGVEIAVVTLPTLGGRSVEEVAVDLFQRWGIGKKGKDEGVLLLVARGERKIRIEVGYGLEGTIPDGLAGEIIRDTITARFREGRFGEGIEAGVRRIAETIAREKQISLETLQASPVRPRLVAPRGDQRRLVSKATLIFVLLLIGLMGIALAQERSVRGHRGSRRIRNRFFGFPVAPSGGGWSGGGFGSGGSGGFGGFGGGSSGGGGASGGW